MMLIQNRLFGGTFLAIALLSTSIHSYAEVVSPHELTRKKAGEIALKRIGGGKIADIDKKRDGYEVEIDTPCAELTVFVQAPYGRITKIDREEKDFCENIFENTENQ